MELLLGDPTGVHIRQQRTLGPVLPVLDAGLDGICDDAALGGVLPHSRLR
jgi:hypothetical protein